MVTINREKYAREGFSPLIPKEGVRCGNSKLNDWTPCGGRNTAVKDKKDCDRYECPYQEFEAE